MIVGTVKKSIAAMASRWLRRSVSQRFVLSGSPGARRIQRETVCSETSNPSIRSSPCMRGAPHVGFSVTIRKMRSRISVEIFFLPITRRALDIRRQYSANPERCQRITVFGLTIMRACFQPDQNLRARTQKSLSNAASRSRGCLRFSTASYCR